jgi:hypothetical protein
MTRLLPLVALVFASGSIATSINFPPPPPPLKYNGTKLVNDADHLFMPAGPDDMRGPCPGLNTLASHGVCREYFSCRSYV